MLIRSLFAIVMAVVGLGSASSQAVATEQPAPVKEITAKSERKPIPKPRYRPAIYQTAS